MIDKVLQYAKAIAALVGSIVTAILAVVPPDQFKWLTILGVAATAITTFAVPNKVLAATPPAA